MRGLDRAQLRALSQRSDARGLLQLAMHAGLLVLTGALVHEARGSAWLVAAMLLEGIVLVFLFCAMHEAAHRTAFATRAVNDALAWACGLLLVLPPEYFRLYHFAHHRYTQDPARDPELSLAPARRLRTYLWRISGLPNWISRLKVTLGHALTGTVGEDFVPALKRAAVVREARVFWGIYLAVFLLSCLLRRTDALFYWVIPALLGQPFLRLYLMGEHAGCALSNDVYENTRTTRTHVAVRLLAWQMPYHVEHHAFPSVPFHALPRVHALVRERLRACSPGYLALHRQLIAELLGRRAAPVAPAVAREPR